MKKYRVTVIADKYPTEYIVEASSVATALARALRLWQQRFKGSRATEWKVSAVKV